jgi:hypothetical protein
LRLATALVIAMTLFVAESLLQIARVPAPVRMWGPLAAALVAGGLTVWLLQPLRRE